MAPQVPEWEGSPPEAGQQGTLGFLSRKPVAAPGAAKEEQATSIESGNITRSKLTLMERFDRVVPAHRRYFGRSRKTFLLILLAVFLCLLALILGLGIGLSKKHKAADLPLPSKGGIQTGDLTYYGVALGACGVASTDAQSVCAVSHLLYDAASTSGNPNQNPLCGRKIRVVRYDERVSANRSIDVTVVDRCVGCKADDLDLSPTAFNKVANPDLGRVTGSWAWL